MPKLIWYKQKIWSVAAIIGLLLFFHWLGWLAPLENGLTRLLRPSLNLAQQTSSQANQFYNQGLDKQDLLKLAQSLEAENKQLLMANAQLSYLKEENEILRQHLRFFENNNFNYLLARVMIKQLPLNKSGEISQILIDRGSQQGLITGLAVLDSQGLIIGRVGQVKKYSAEVSLLTDNHCRLAVTIQQTNRVMGIAQGQAGLTVSLDFIPQTENIAVNDLVVTSGLEANLPAGLLLGRVSQVDKASNELWQQAIIKPLGQLSNLSLVSVLLPANINSD